MHITSIGEKNLKSRNCVHNIQSTIKKLNRFIFWSYHCLKNVDDKKPTSCYRLNYISYTELTSLHVLNILRNQPIYVCLFTEHLHAFPEEFVFVLGHGQLIFGFLQLSLLNVHYVPTRLQHFLSLFQLSLTVLQLNLKFHIKFFLHNIDISYTILCILLLFVNLFVCFAFQDFIFLIWDVGRSGLVVEVEGGI